MKIAHSLILALALQVCIGSLASHAQAPCRFVLGFADMVHYVGVAEVGPCLEEQRTTTGVERFAVDGFSSVEVEAGASVQWTSRGLLVWHPSDNSTQFYSRRGIWFQSASGSNFVSMAELIAPSAPTATQTPTTNALGDANSTCFRAATGWMIETFNSSPAEKARAEAEGNAKGYLCNQALERDGARGVACYTRAWDAATGMERVFAGSGRQVYDEKYAACMQGR